MILAFERVHDHSAATLQSKEADQNGQEWGSNREPWCLDRSLLGRTSHRIAPQTSDMRSVVTVLQVLASLWGWERCDGPRSDRGHWFGRGRPRQWLGSLQVRLSSTGTAREVEVIGLGVTPDGDVAHPQRGRPTVLGCGGLDLGSAGT